MLAPVHLANRNSIRASLFQLMPYLREVLPDAAAAAEPTRVRKPQHLNPTLNRKE